MSTRVFAITVALTLLVFGCQGYSSYDYLDGKFITKDTTPVDLIAPSDKATSSRSLKFVWTKRSGAGKYLLEVSTNSNFSSPVLSKTLTDGAYTLVNSDLSGISALDAFSYYWRVTSLYSDQRVVSAVFVFHVLDDNIVYVNSGSSVSEQTGNKTSPWRKITDAIYNAESRRQGNSALAMDILVAAGAYSDEIDLRPGISLKGGYSPSTWVRNISSNTTTIQSTTDISIRGNSTITNATVVEGFKIFAGANGSSYAFYLSGGSPTIRLNTITSNSSSTITLIYGLSSSAVISENNISVHATTFATAGISINQSGGIPYTVRISNNTISASTAGPGTAVTLGALCMSCIIENNIISGGGSGGIGSYGIQILTATDTIIRNNVIYGGGATPNTGISLFGSINSIIVNNTINGGSANAATGIAIDSGANPIIANNIIFTTSSGSPRYCVNEQNTAADPVSFQNNLLFDCPQALYRDENTTNRTLESDLNTEASINAGAAGTADNNIGPATITNFAAVNFTSASDLHITAATPAAIRTGGKDTSQSTCGTGSASCGAVTTDRDGLTRTVQYSLGAYEF